MALLPFTPVRFPLCFKSLVRLQASFPLPAHRSNAHSKCALQVHFGMGHPLVGLTLGFQHVPFKSCEVPNGFVNLTLE